MTVASRIIIGSIFTGLTVVAVAVPASRAQADQAPGDTLSLSLGSTRSVTNAPLTDCDSGVPSAGECSVETTTQTSDAARVHVSHLPDSERSLVAADGVSLAQASRSATIYTKTWWQTARGFFWFNWSEKHSGRIYFDGSRVWSTTSSAGLKGSHTCDQGSGFGFTIKVTRCSTEKLGTASLNEWDYFQAHVVANGVPIYRSHNQHAHITAKGAVS